MAGRAVGDERVLALLVGGTCAALGIVLGMLVGYAATGLAIGGVLGATASLLSGRPADRGGRPE